MLAIIIFLYSAYKNALALQLHKGFEEVNKNIDNKLEMHRRTTQEQIEKAVKDFEARVDAVISKIKKDFNAEISKIKSDVNHCYEYIKQIDNSNMSKLVDLEKSQNVLIKHQNRPDIIITGLPAALSNLKDIILKIGEIYEIPVTDCDINQCIYRKNLKEVLVKFNTIPIRDRIMKKYYETRELKLNGLIRGELVSRIFLNDHLTPMASKLTYLCRKLKKAKRIINSNFVIMIYHMLTLLQMMAWT